MGKKRQHELSRSLTSDVESRLIAAGWESRERASFDAKVRRGDVNVDVTDPPRFIYRLGSWRVLTPSREQPWVTVQRLSGDFVHWYVDFPLDVPLDRVFGFMQ